MWESKNAIKWTRLSCRTFAANAVRLQLHALAYNLGNFMRTLAMPKSLYAKWVRVTGAVLRQSSVRLERGSPCWANAPHQHAEPGGSAFALCPTPSPRPPG